MAEPQARQGDEHRNAVEREEEDVLATHMGATAVPEGPEAVAEVGEGCRCDDADRLGGERLVLQRSGVQEEVEEAHVDDEGKGAHDAELRDLAEEHAHGSADPVDEGRARDRCGAPLRHGGMLSRATPGTWAEHGQLGRVAP